MRRGICKQAETWETEVYWDSSLQSWRTTPLTNKGTTSGLITTSIVCVCVCLYIFLPVSHKYVSLHLPYILCIQFPSQFVYRPACLPICVPLCSCCIPYTSGCIQVCLCAYENASFIHILLQTCSVCACCRVVVHLCVTVLTHTVCVRNFYCSVYKSSVCIWKQSRSFCFCINIVILLTTIVCLFVMWLCLCSFLYVTLLVFICT